MKEEGIPMYIILDTLGIKSYCCRIALMTPICLAFETENRNIVNGKENASTEDLNYRFSLPREEKIDKFKFKNPISQEHHKICGVSTNLMGDTEHDVYYVHVGEGMYVPELKMNLYNAM